MKDVKVVMPVRAAFYGMHEFSVQGPGGHFITFAQPVAPAQQSHQTACNGLEVLMAF